MFTEAVVILLHHCSILATSAPCCANFGEGTGNIILDDVACAGTESSIFDCTYTSVHNCGHSEDAGVVCSGLKFIYA